MGGCAGVCLGEQENDGHTALSQQPAMEGKFERLKGASADAWAANYAHATAARRGPDYLRAALTLPSAVFASPQIRQM